MGDAGARVELINDVGVVFPCDIVVTGTNLSYGAGDSVKVKWTQDGTAHELTVTPSATTTTKMTFEAVAAFDDIPEGTFLTFVFNLRGQTEEFQTMLVDA